VTSLDWLLIENKTAYSTASIRGLVDWLEERRPQHYKPPSKYQVLTARYSRGPHVGVSQDMSGWVEELPLPKRRNWKAPGSDLELLSQVVPGGFRAPTPIKEMALRRLQYIIWPEVRGWGQALRDNSPHLRENKNVVSDFSGSPALLWIWEDWILQ
jgi:hypothetical protein